MKNEEKRVWFITGASKGLGLQLTNKLLSLGHKVVAASRDKAAFEKAITAKKTNFYPIETDITSEDEVKKTIDLAIARFEQIDTTLMATKMTRVLFQAYRFSQKN